MPAGVDPAAAQLLGVLVKQGPSRQGELAGCTYLDPSTISRQVRQLVERGLVERRPDPGDGRAVQIAPTPAGQELFARMYERREDLVRQVLDGWDADDVLTLATLLRRLNDEFDHRRADLGSAWTASTGPPQDPR
jgi:DNA-binding MarR family transcriptional regulator